MHVTMQWQCNFFKFSFLVNGQKFEKTSFRNPTPQCGDGTFWFSLKLAYMSFQTQAIEKLAKTL